MRKWIGSAVVLLLVCWHVGATLPSVQAGHDEKYERTMFWGTYRPGLYFGVKTRAPIPIQAGLMWSSASGNTLRHTCRHEDQLSQYGWTRHDGHHFGQHEVIDPTLQMKIVSSFVKEESEHEHGGHWVARTRARSLGADTFLRSFFFYLVFPEACRLDPIPIKKKGLDEVVVTGWCPDVEHFTFTLVQEGKDEIPSDLTPQQANVIPRYHVLGLHRDDESSWNMQGAVEEDLRKGMRRYLMQAGEKNSFSIHTPVFLSNKIEKNSNVLIFQKMASLPLTLDAIFLQHEALEGQAELPARKRQSHINSFSGTRLTDRIVQSVAEFDHQFDRTFHLRDAQGLIVDAPMEKCAMAALSNMVGGLGYWHGEWLIYQGEDRRPQVQQAQSLFSACPSRPFFPRGFLWDEGFHQLLLSEWNPQITMNVLADWFNLMDTESGWIPREQILGGEARSRVPEAFQAQHRDHGNPPTFFLTIDKLLRHFAKRLQKQELSHEQEAIFQEEESLEGDARREYLIQEDAFLRQTQSFLQSVFPRLQAWYQWFVGSQDGPRPGLFRWRGRTKDHLLSSGLDDYPRSPLPPTDQEAHLDLLCWMILSSRSLEQISRMVNDHEAEARYAAHGASYAQALEMHWDESRGLYSDVINITSQAYSPHQGYVNLFPLMVGAIPPDSPRLLRIYEWMQQPEHLWTSHGLRSLSRSDSSYQQGENYWRGPIWMNMNYLTLAGLKQYYFQGPHEPEARTLYALLRENLVRNVVGQYRTTGYLWEQYHEETGRGTHSHPFTGWTALILNIMSELY